MIMRFRPANISLINRRHYLPRLLLILSSKKQMQKPPQRFEDVDRVTPYQGRELPTSSGVSLGAVVDWALVGRSFCSEILTDPPLLSAERGAAADQRDRSQSGNPLAPAGDTEKGNYA